MHDRRARRLLTDIAALRTAERAAFYEDLAHSRTQEREAEIAAERAEARTAAAAEAWEEHIAGTAFAPELARAFAKELIGYGEIAAIAGDYRARMANVRSDAEQAWYDGDARCRLAERALANKNREMRRDRDERALATLADRVALTWRRA